MVLLLTDTVAMTRRMGAYAIANALRKNNIDVQVLDFLSKWELSSLFKILNSIENIEWVGISLSYLHYHKHTENPKRMTDLPYSLELDLISYFQKRNIPIILGGPNADTIKNYVTNFWISVGYSDLAIIKFHEHITENKELIYEILNDNKIIFADKHYGNIDLNEISSIYVEDDFVSNELVPLEISRGCIFKCKFCEFAYLGKKPGTYIRDKESIKSDIINLYHNNGIDTFLFSDDTFNDSLEKMKMIKEIRNETNIPFKFWAYGRLDLMVSHPKMIDMIGDIGWQAITFGVETLNKKTGSSIGKGMNPEKLKECLVNIRKKYPSLHLQINLIIGLPHSTKEDIKESVDWIINHNIANYLRVIDLDIKDPNGLSFSSEFSKDPLKYGYKIISTDTIRYNWSNDYWTTNTAKEYAIEVNQYIDKKMKDNRPFHIQYYINEKKNYFDKNLYFKNKSKILNKKNRQK